MPLAVGSRPSAGRARRLSPMGRLAVLLTAIVAVAHLSFAVWLEISALDAEGRNQGSWLLFGAALGLSLAVVATAPSIVLILWADVWANPPSRRGVIVVLIGTVVSLGFTLWLLAEVMFPREFRGADFTVIWLVPGQLLILAVTWLTAFVARADEVAVQR